MSVQFPPVSEETRVRMLQPPKGRVKAVLDTDTFNEIDDQFAVVYALLSPEKIDLQAIYAAPYFNEKSILCLSNRNRKIFFLFGFAVTIFFFYPV